MKYPEDTDLFIFRWFEWILEGFDMALHPFDLPRWVRRLYVCTLPLAIVVHIAALVALFFLMLVLSILANIAMYALAIWNGENYFE